MKIDNFVLACVQKQFSDMNAYKTDSIQMLWSGYGEIARYAIPSVGQTVIVKIVNPTNQHAHPRGWGGAVSHQRKVDSYLNELTFYKSYAHQTNDLCRVPYSIGTAGASDTAADTANKKLEQSLDSLAKESTDEISQNSAFSFLMMEDLDAAGFELRCSEAPLTVIRLGIRWLAHFHAKFLNQAVADLWSIGTYWHLSTRPDEFARMPQSELKNKAKKIDEKLNNARFQTLLHGDAKLANFCFTSDVTDLAAVDFQYVGRGAGIKDVMYFLGSCFHSDELQKHADSLLDEYFLLLKDAIADTGTLINFTELEAEWRYLYAFAWADFHRFLKGWASEHYKINDYMGIQTNSALAAC